MKKHLNNILAVAGSDVVSRLLGFATYAYLARILGTSSFGVMSIGLSVLSYVVMLSSPGLHVQGTRDVASGKGNGYQYEATVNSLRLVLASGLVLLNLLLIGFFVDSTVVRLTIIVFTLSGLPIASSLDWYFQGKEHLVVYSGSKVIVALIFLIMTLLLVRGEMDVVWTSVSFLIANVVAAAWLALLFLNQGKHVSFVWRPRQWQALLRSSLPLGVSSFLAQTIMNLPVLIVGAICTSQDAGLFNAAMKLIFAAMVIDRVFYIIFFPVISRLRSVSYEQFKNTTALALKVVLAVIIPIVAVAVAYSHEIVILVYGQGFAGAALPFRFLLFYFFASVVNTVIMCAMIADNRESEYLKIMAVATAVLILLCIILSFANGLSGAAASVAIGEGLMALLLYFKERALFTRLVTVVAPSFIAGGVMVFVLILMNPISMPITIIAGSATFLLALWLLKGISKEEFTFVRERFL